MSASFDIDAVLKALKSSLPMSQEAIPLHEPSFGGNEWAYIKECLDTRWVSSAGKFVDLFEKQLAAYTGAKQAVAVVNGTAALHVCLKVAGVQPGEEVLIPTLTFVATANAVTYCGAIPHFIDSEEKTLGVDPHKLFDHLNKITEIRGGGCWNRDTGRPIKAVVPMHVYGHPVDLEPLCKVCQHFGLALIEDAAESLGSFYKGKHTGNWGKVSALSFNGNKTITTGGGGAILTNDEALGILAKHLTTTAKVPHKWVFEHDMIGFNYRLPNINAALGCAQLEELPVFLAKKRALAQRYRKAFANLDGIRFFDEPDFACSNYWLNVLLLDEQHANHRDDLLEMTNADGIMTRPTWTLMHCLSMFRKCPRMDLGTAESLARRLVNIPSSAELVDTYAKA
jgi:perosamine synthetase